MRPVSKAKIIFINFTAKKPRFDSASRGSMPCPSCAMELASSTENGIEPWANSVTKTRCGPDSGIIPTYECIPCAVQCKHKVVNVQAMRLNVSDRALTPGDLGSGIILRVQISLSFRFCLYRACKYRNLIRYVH